jgi:hypothetical protein
MPGNLFDRIAMSHHDVEWWVTDEGLHMEVIPPVSAVPELNRFDQVAGSLVIAKWEESYEKRNTHLSKGVLREIAAELDKAKFKLLDVLQPAQQAQLNKHNELMGRAGIKSFERLAESNKYSQFLRRRLYVARKRFMEAAGKPSKRSRQPIPKIFFSSNPIL